MIIFTDISIDSIYDYWYRIRPDLWDGIVVMNINSYDATYPPLYGILPGDGSITNEAMLAPDTDKFDYEYGLYLLNGPGSQALYFIVANEYYGGNTLYVYQIYRSPYRDSVIESLSRLMLLRYGMESHIISDIEDLHYLNKSSTTLSIDGLVNLSEDLGRFSILYPSLFNMGDTTNEDY